MMSEISAFVAAHHRSPTYRALAKRLGVTPTAVIEMCHRLVRDGHLLIEGRGIRLPHVSTEAALQELRELLDHAEDATTVRQRARAAIVALGAVPPA